VSQGISLNELARRLGRAKSGLHKLAKNGQIPRNADNTFDENAVREALEANTDPARRKPVHRSPVHANSEHGVRRSVVSTEDEAKAAVGLIIKVLRAEGSSVDDLAEVDFGMARTADTILKAYERDLKMAQRRKELVPLASVKQHIEKAFIGYRQAIQRLPSRFAAQIAAEAGCDASVLDASLSKAIATVLDELSSPVVRA